MKSPRSQMMSDDHGILHFCGELPCAATVAPPEEMPQKMPSSRASRRGHDFGLGLRYFHDPIDTRRVTDLQYSLLPGANTGNLQTGRWLHADDLNLWFFSFKRATPDGAGRCP